MTSIFTIRKNYTVKRDDPKIATKGTFPQILAAINDKKRLSPIIISLFYL